MPNKLNCFSCGKEIPLLGNLGRRDECPFCHADMHVCKNCQHYDPKVYNECKEPQADRVQERDRANFCDYFLIGTGAGGTGNSADQLKAAAEALFKKNN
jgi:ribosome-binding protein aMBF1 (putative translation factor)